MSDRIEAPFIERWIKTEIPFAGIFVRCKLSGEHWLDYEIWEVGGINSDDDTPFLPSNHSGSEEANMDLDEDMLLKGSIKWDGCMQWYFPEQQGPHFHADDLETARALWVLVVETIYSLAKELIPAWDPS